MKKILILNSVLLLSIAASSQGIYDPFADEILPGDGYNFFYLEQPTDAEKELYKTNHVKTITELRGNKQQKIARELSFDSNGEMLTLTRYSGGGGRKTVYSSFNRARPNNITYNRKGEELKKNVFTYNGDSLLLEELHFKNGKLKSRIVNDYDNKKVKESRYYTDGNDKPTRIWSYEYYADGSKKTSRLHKNGQLKYVWNYECKEEGEQARKHQDTMMVCKNESIDVNGNKTVTVRRYNEKGLPIKEVYVYSPDDKIIDLKYFNNKDELFYQYSSSANRKNVIFSYFTKGRLHWKHEINYDDNQQILESVTYTRGKVTSRTINEYNTEGKLVTSRSTNQKYRFNSETRYTYDNNMLTASITIDNKGTINRARKLMYNFY